MSDESRKEVWMLEDEYINKRISGDEVDIDGYCNRPYLTAEDKQELRERLLGYEAAQKGLDKLVEEHINSDAVWERISAHIAQSQSVKLAAEDSSSEEQIKSRLMIEFSSKVMAFDVYEASLLYKDMTSVSMVFRKGKIITTELDGCEVDFYLEGQEKRTRQISDGSILIDFGELGILIQDYQKVNYTIRKGETIIVDGSLGNEQ